MVRGLMKSLKRRMERVRSVIICGGFSWRILFMINFIVQEVEAI